MNKTYDLIVIGSGSIGVPVAMEFSRNKQSVLVIDSLASPGQGQDKKAIGGIRATHSDKGKILVSQSCLLYTSPSPRDRTRSRMPSSA